MANIVELREMSDEQIDDLLEDAREELFNLRFQQATSQLDNTIRVRIVRREIAQLTEVLHKRRLAVAEAARHPSIAQALSGKSWEGLASYDYEEGAWRVEFVDENDNEVATALVDLNKRRPQGRRARHTTAQPQFVRKYEIAG